MRLRTPKAPGSETRKEYVHMLNGTLTATERTLCCVLENYQTPDGVRCGVARGCWRHAGQSWGWLEVGAYLATVA